MFPRGLSSEPRRDEVFQLGGGELFDALVCRNAETPTGRIHACQGLWEGLGSTHLHLADAAHKAALYALVAAGYCLVAVAGDEFVLGVEEESCTPALQGEVKDIAVQAARGVLNDTPVEIRVSRRERCGPGFSVVWETNMLGVAISGVRRCFFKAAKTFPLLDAHGSERSHDHVCAANSVNSLSSRTVFCPTKHHPCKSRGFWSVVAGHQQLAISFSLEWGPAKESSHGSAT